MPSPLPQTLAYSPAHHGAQPRSPGDRFAQAYLALFGLVSLGYIVAFARRRSPWPLGDWLINYQGGFVRRGLPGQAILLAARSLHLPLVAAAAATQTACVLCLVVCCWSLVSQPFREGGTLWQKAMLLSPATLAFVWLDPGLALRKEIALFALLALLMRLLRTPAVPLRSDVWLAAFLAVACPLLLLAHEGLVCYMPYLAALVVLGLGSLARALRVGAVAAALSLAAVIAATLHPGDQAISDRICASVGGQSSGLCAGPIGYLGLSRAQYAGEVATLMHDRRMMAAFAVTTALALLPALAGLLDLWRNPVSRRTRAVLPVATGLAALASAVLFLQAQDWSRWIYIHIVCLWLTLLYAAELRAHHNAAMRSVDDAASGGVSGPPPALTPAKPRGRYRRWAAWALLLVYATTWHLPEWIILGHREYFPFGYTSLLLRLERHLGRFPGASRQ